MIDADQIIKNTQSLIDGSSVIKDKLSTLKKISIKEYKSLHRNFLTPTSIKIDCNRFKNEILNFSDYFMQWGKHHSELPRYGIALVNLDGNMHKNDDPINGSLYEWNALNPKNAIIESDCKCATKLMDISSLSILNSFQGFWYRSNILKWHRGARFLPHIDNLLPAPWIRLWGSTTSNISLRFWDQHEMTTVKDIEPGRIYIIDTSIVHDAEALEDNTYQFFLCLSPDAFKILEKVI